jgi:two-component system chemotaxis response regulator CheY
VNPAPNLDMHIDVTQGDASVQALVIDDSRTMRLILGRMLRDLGMEVTEATNGREALSQLDAGLDPDVVLVDWNMPEMNGIEFVETVRKPPYASTARLVMVTTETEISQISRALEVGADEYVMKPFTQESISEKLQLLGLEI